MWWQTCGQATCCFNLHECKLNCRIPRMHANWKRVKLVRIPVIQPTITCQMIAWLITDMREPFWVTQHLSHRQRATPTCFCSTRKVTYSKSNSNVNSLTQVVHWRARAMYTASHRCQPSRAYLTNFERCCNSDIRCNVHM